MRLVEFKLSMGAAIATFLTGLTACSDDKGNIPPIERKQYLETCAVSTSHLQKMTKGIVSSETFCPCMYDNTIANVEQKYAGFSSKLMLISIGIYPLSTDGVNSYVSQLTALIDSRSDGQKAYFATLKSLKTATSICDKRS